MTKTLNLEAIPHYWQAEVGYLPLSDVGTRRPVHMITSGESTRLAESLESMRLQDYAILSVTLHAYCSNCSGTGKIADKRRRRVLYATVPCKACKGHDGSLAIVSQEGGR